MSYINKLKQRALEVSKKAEETAKQFFSEDSIKEYRMSICKQCEHYIELTSGCAKCGCFLPAKTKIAGTSCPIGKWAKVIRSDDNI